MTELSFLIELLLNHELPKDTKALIASRIKEVEANLNRPPMQIIAPPVYSQTMPAHTMPAGVPQAASTLAAMARHAAAGVTYPAPVLAVEPSAPAPVPPEAIAQTPATAAAMQSRANTIAQAISGKPEKGRTSPRKF